MQTSSYLLPVSGTNLVQEFDGMGKPLGKPFVPPSFLTSMTMQEREYAARMLHDERASGSNSGAASVSVGIPQPVFKGGYTSEQIERHVENAESATVNSNGSVSLGVPSWLPR